MEMSGKERQKKCRYCHRFMGPKWDETHCISDGRKDDKVRVVTEEECEKCEKYESKYIEYPITVNGIDNEKIRTTGRYEPGSVCGIRPCEEKYNKKTYIGIYIGELPIAINTQYNKNTGILHNSCINNPAIFVPELKKIIFGIESWWQIIDKVEDAEDISDEEIGKQWYVQMMMERNQ